VKDAGNPVQGRTRWRRFAAVVVPAAAAAGAIVFGMANGAIAASFAVSGQTFKVQAAELHGWGFVQYGGVAEKNYTPADLASGKAHPVAVSGIGRADLTKLCQSVKVPNAPISMVIEAGGEPGKPAKATNLLIDMADLQGDAHFINIDIGQDASTLGAAGPDAHGDARAFGQQADEVIIKDLKQVAWSTHAGTFTLNGLHLSISTDFTGGKPRECF
jgi:Family of unknown function (DUF6230)